MDRDGNGFIEYSEFVEAAVNKSLLVTRENCVKCFKTIDKDGNGMITKQELQDAFENPNCPKNK